MESVSNERILIDTNVLVYCWDKDFSDGAKKLLRTLKDHHNDLGVSIVSGFELLKNAHKKEAREYYLKLLNYIGTIDINPQISVNAAMLHHMYCREFSKNKVTPPCDLLIGGTCIYHTGVLLLTADKSDFHTNFWPIVAQTHIIYETGNDHEGRKKNLVNIYLRKFDYSKVPEDLKAS
jgi:predicted nucleic acid-binding protein